MHDSQGNHGVLFTRALALVRRAAIVLAARERADVEVMEGPEHRAHPAPLRGGRRRNHASRRLAVVSLEAGRAIDVILLNAEPEDPQSDISRKQARCERT